MSTQYAIAEEYGRNSAKRLVIHDTELLNAEARLAMTLIERWSMVTGELNGEDTAGRAVLRPCPPNEVVDRACTIAESAMNAFRNRGWIQPGPDISELLKRTDD